MSDTATTVTAVAGIVIAALAAWTSYLGVRTSRKALKVAENSAVSAGRAAAAAALAADSAAAMAATDAKRMAIEQDAHQRSRAAENESSRQAAENIRHISFPIKGRFAVISRPRYLTLRNLSADRIKDVSVEILSAQRTGGAWSASSFGFDENTVQSYEQRHAAVWPEIGAGDFHRFGLTDLLDMDLLNGGAVNRCKFRVRWNILGQAFEGTYEIAAT